MKHPLKQTAPPAHSSRTQYFMEHPEQFNFFTLESNEMERGDGLTPLAKIPDLGDRIRFIKEAGGFFTEVRLVIGRETDEETGETEEETVILGHTSDRMLYGMMSTSNIYHNYFDTSGNLIYDPMEPEDEEEPEGTEPENEEPQDEETEKTTGETEEPAQEDPEEELRELVAAELQKKNKIQLGDTILVRCPEPSSSIRYLKANQHGVRHVQYIYERWYDNETRQNRNLKTTIGQMSDEFPGAMIPNERYKRYFDMETGLPLNQDGQKEQSEQKDEKEQSIAADTQNPKAPEPGKREIEELRRSVSRYGIESDEAREAAIDYLQQLIPENSGQKTAMNGQGDHYAAPASGQTGRQNGNHLESLYERANEKKEQIRVLVTIFDGIRSDIYDQAKRHPDDLVNTYKTRKINAILLEIRKLCKGSGFEEFLELIQEPEEVEKDGETYLTGMTYSDVQILLEHYGAVFSHMRHLKM